MLLSGLITKRSGSGTPCRESTSAGATRLPHRRERIWRRHYGLTAKVQEEGQTWSYLLADTSVGNIRRLVADPVVADTHNIDRRRFELTGDNPPGPLEGRHWHLWSALFSIAAGLTAAWIGQVRLRFAGATAARTAAAALRAAAEAITRGIPEARAEVLGFFLFFYAMFLFLALAGGRLVLEAGRIPDDGRLGWTWLGWLSSRPDLMTLLELAILVLLVPFAIGLWTRASYWLIGTGMTVWVLVWIESQHSNAHVWLVTMVMIVCLLWWPWWLAFLSFATPWESLFTLVRSRWEQPTPVDTPSPIPTAVGLRDHLRPIHLALIVLVCVHAILRLPAGVGRFDAYSHTMARPTNSTGSIQSIRPTGCGLDTERHAPSRSRQTPRLTLFSRSPEKSLSRPPPPGGFENSIKSGHWSRIRRSVSR